MGEMCLVHGGQPGGHIALMDQMAPGAAPPVSGNNRDQAQSWRRVCQSFKRTGYGDVRQPLGLLHARVGAAANGNSIEPLLFAVYDCL